MPNEPQAVHIWTIILPWPDKALSPNAPKRHWRSKQGAKVAAYSAAFWRTKKALAGKRLAGRCLAVELRFCPPDGRKRDLDNLFASLKSAMDGMCAALEIDDADIEAVTLTRGIPDEVGEVWVTLRVLGPGEIF